MKTGIIGKLSGSLLLLVLVLILVAGLSRTGNAQVAAPEKAKLDQFFDRLAEKNKAMGSLVIAKGGSVVYGRAIGYGQINGSEKKPLTVASKYRIGSITKMFTAVMIFQLVEEGKLRLNDPLGKFFSQVANAGKITVAQVLAHRSGVHDVTGDPDYRNWRTKSITKDEMLAIIAKAPSDFEPDSSYAYSNSGYFLLGYIVEKLTGKPYEDVLRERITSKIGLNDTYASTGGIDVSKNESYSYRYVLDWQQHPETNSSVLFGSGSVTSTAPDMARFIQALFDGKLVSSESLNQMMEKKLGITTFTYNGKTFYGHTGGVDGFGAWLVYLPEEKLAVAYGTNGKVYPVSDIVDAVFTIYWKQPFEIPSFNSIAVSAEVLDKYTGVYTTEGAPVKFTVTRDGTTLFLQMTGRPAIPVEPMAEDRFRIESVGIEIVFDAVKKQMVIVREGREKVWRKE